MKRIIIFSLFFLFYLIYIKPIYSMVDLAGKCYLKIFYDSNKYYLKGNIMDIRNHSYEIEPKSINKIDIQNFLVVLKGPLIKEFSLESLGIDQKWLDQNAESAVNEFLSQLNPNKRNQLDNNSLIRQFRNYDLIRHQLIEHFNSMVSDSYPEISLEILLESGESIKIYSNSQHCYALPWRITMDNQEFLVYDKKISLGLLSFIPEDFSEKQRIQGLILKKIIVSLLIKNNSRNPNYE